MEKKIIIELHYLPCIEYLGLLNHFKAINIESSEHYHRQSLRNRCYIITSQGIQKLTIPILKPSKSKNLMKDIKIDNSKNWQLKHWRAICTAYGKAPYFKFYIDCFETLFKKKYTSLVEFNLSGLDVILKILNSEKEISLTREFNKNPNPSLFFDFRNKINLNNFRQIENNIHHISGIDLVWSAYKQYSYTQLFFKHFIPNLSILDLIMCKGPEAIIVLKNSIELFKNNISLI